MKVENKTIIITDPCYIVKEDDWERCDYGDNMKVLGIKNYLSSSTIYGDWSCTTFNADTKEAIGEFCADAGLVGVFLLDEVIEYNPEFAEWIAKHPWCVTVIKNFTGDVDIILEEIQVANEEEDSGLPETYEEVRVIGKGSLNFFTTQTGL